MGKSEPARGRSREVARPSNDREAILDAAHQVLLRTGAKGLKLDAVAREARLDVSTVVKHFGSRHRLIEELMDRLYAAPAAGLAADTARLPSVEERWRAYLKQVRRMHDDREATEAYFDLATVALRDPSLRARLGRLNARTVRGFREVIGAGDDAMAELILAAVDGIELRRALAGDDYPIDAVLGLLDRVALTEYLRH
jgi:AcrR family transcriptional regulator